MPLLLGLDIGSTFVKAVVSDRCGGVVAEAARRVPVRRPQPGWMERDAHATWRAASDVIRRVSAGRVISAVGMTGCGNGAVFVDAKAKPIRAGILASDQRAADFVHFEPWTRQVAYPGQTASLLRWFRSAEPAAARKLAHVLPWKDFIRARLTDEIATDPTDAGAAGWIEVATRQMRADDQAIPPLRESLASAGEVTTTAAHMTGLAAGTPVFTGCIDCEASAIGSGIGQGGDLSLIAGTWSINQTFVARLPRRSDQFLVNPSAEPGRWLVLEGSPDSASHFDWFVRATRGRGDFARVAQQAAVARADGLFFLPGLFGCGAAFMGMRPEHNLAAMARAVMQGVCFAHRAHVEKLRAGAPQFRRARLAGGAARSDFWCQLFADTLGLNVEVPAAPEPGALGAALLAGVGAGIWPSFAAAQHDAVRVARSFAPRENLDTAYAEWRERHRQLQTR